MSWKTMETAPLDGTEIIVRFPLQGNVKKLASFSTIHRFWASKGEPFFPVQQGCEWAAIPLDAAPAVASAAPELPPLPEPTIEGSVMHQELKICYLAPVHFTADQMQAYASAAIDASAPNAALVEDAKRWQFMMRIADNEDGPESTSMEMLRQANESMESGRLASVQLIEMVDAARAALVAAGVKEPT